jgi:plastocyanin
MRLRVVPLVAGLIAAALIAGFPASAADTTVTAQAFTWDKTAIAVNVGDKVTWANGSGGIPHNVCVAKPGDTPDAANDASCTEFRNGAPAADWSGYTNAHPFATAGTYKFICQQHPTTMAGTVTVGDGTTTTGTGTGTGTSTTPPPDTQPTDTTTTPTQTQTETTAADTTAPAFTGKIKRRASRKSLVLDFRSSEDATLHATIFRRPPHGRAFAQVGQASAKVRTGHNVVTLPRKAGGSGRSGSYRVKLQLVDAAGNKSATKTLSYKLS